MYVCIRIYELPIVTPPDVAERIRRLRDFHAYTFTHFCDAMCPSRVAATSCLY